MNDRSQPDLATQQVTELESSRGSHTAGDKIKIEMADPEFEWDSWLENQAAERSRKSAKAKPVRLPPAQVLQWKLGQCNEFIEKMLPEKERKAARTMKLPAKRKRCAQELDAAKGNMLFDQRCAIHRKT